MKITRSCLTCAFMREGDIRDRYAQGKGWITHRGMVCHLYPPYKGTQSPVEPDGICSRWTDAETLDQPLARLCPQTLFVSSASQTSTREPDASSGEV